jgi:ferredoxin-NADP reductase/predicted pyridoxine 5'-phosphate oxidase superfamily flavin-nucleotide-binding protein
MPHKFAQIAFTPTVRAIQESAGSRASYSAMDEGADYNHELTDREAEFIGARDSFYVASIGETGWPYLQHRGGPAGFMKVLDSRTIGFADYSGNRQYVSTGNFATDDRVALFFMDYPNRRRLKMLGRVGVVGVDQPGVLARLEDADYPAQVERGFIIQVEAFDWNCPQHITPRFTAAEVERSVAPLVQAVPEPAVPVSEVPSVLGEGPLELIVRGIRQLTSRVRAYELRDPAGGSLPEVGAGAHLRVPIRLPSGEWSERHYSISSDPKRRDVYEIAVLREDEGTGGSRALHETYELGRTLRVDLAVNHFGLHDDARPAVLIAGGIGITPIKAMAATLAARGSRFHLHYAGRSYADMAFVRELQEQFTDRMTTYSKADNQCLDIESALESAPADALIYVCGPERLISGVLNTAKALGIARDRIRVELFS